MDEPASNLLALLLIQTQLSLALVSAAIALKLLLVFLLVVINGFFVASEFALVSVRRPKLEASAAAGNKSGQAALRLLREPTSFISAVQLGVTLASLALGWIGEPTIAEFLDPIVTKFAPEGTVLYVAHILAIAIAFSIVSFLHIVLGELFPKMFALERAETWALICARPLELFARVFRPVIWIFNRAGLALARLAGLQASLDHASVYTEDEIRSLIDVSQARGHLRGEERRLIHKVFEFSETLVREAMVPRTEMAAVASDLNLEELVQAFQRHGYSRLPVYRDSLDDVIGFIHGKDVMPYLLRPESFQLAHVLQSPNYVVDTARLEDVLRQMQRQKFHFGFVVDEYGGVEGVITLEDLLEEIVGDISDEHDEEVNEQIRAEKDGSFLLDGGLVVRDLNRRLKLSIPESDGYTTVAGFLMAEAGHVLQAGDVVKHDSLVFRVETVERRRVISVRMEKEEELESVAKVDLAATS